MITWAILRAALGGMLSTLVNFIRANWRWLLPLLAALGLWWFISHLQTQRDDARQALSNYQQAVKDAQATRRAENTRKELAARDAIASIEINHAEQINQIRRHYDANNKDAEKYRDDRIAAWRDRLRLESANAADRLSEISKPTGQPAEIWKDGNAAAARRDCQTIIDACAVTTSDYNALWDSWHEACQIHGCN